MLGKILKIDTNNLNAYSSGLLQGKAYRILNAVLIEELKQFGLTIPEWKLLGQLKDNPKITHSDLSDLLSVEAPLVTRLIDNLEKRKLLVRSDTTDDRRVKLIEILPSGLEIVDGLEQPIRVAIKKVLGGVSVSDLIAYLRVLEAIVKNGSHSI